MTQFKDIFGTLAEQSRVLNMFLKIEEEKNSFKEILPLTWGKELPGAVHIEVILKCEPDTSA